jgi:hypothetical protein
MQQQLESLTGQGFWRFGEKEKEKAKILSFDPKSPPRKSEGGFFLDGF